MIVRALTFDDVDAVLELARLWHAASEMGQFAFDEAGAKLLAAISMSDPARCAFAAEHDGAIAGLLLGVELRYDYMRARYATDVLIVADRPGAGALLMKRFIAWALQERRVDRVVLGETFGGRDPDKARGWYESLGARRIGGIYVIDREQTP